MATRPRTRLCGMRAVQAMERGPTLQPISTLVLNPRHSSNLLDALGSLSWCHLARHCGFQWHSVVRRGFCTFVAFEMHTRGAARRAPTKRGLAAK
eukprot:15449807-Alexandrium_andersonii.AAC.2